MGLSQDDLTDAEQQQITAGLLTLRIIAGALIMGVATFAAILIIISDGNQNDGWSILCWIAVAAALVAMIMSQFPSAIMSREQEENLSIEHGIALYTTRTILQFAILEGAAFFTLVIFYLTDQWLLLAAAALLMAFMFAKFPTRGKLVRWIEERRQLAALEGNEQ